MSKPATSTASTGYDMPAAAIRGLRSRDTWRQDIRLVVLRRDGIEIPPRHQGRQLEQDTGKQRTV
jgi:hypothetical protein